MSNWYVRSGASGSANGAEWTDAYLSVQTAISATNTASGDIIWVSDDHNESSVTAINLFSNNSVANTIYILCANHTSGNIPPNISTDLETTANVTTNSTISIGNSIMTFYGLNFNINSASQAPFIFGGGTAGQLQFMKFDSCNFAIGNVSVMYYQFSSPGTSTKSIFNNCNFGFGNTSQNIKLFGGSATFNNTTFTSLNSFLPSDLILSGTGSGDNGSEFTFKKCDLSNFGTGKVLYDKFTPGAFDSVIKFEDCVINSSAQIANIANGALGLARCIALRSTNFYGEYYADGFGVMQDSNATYRVGGATDETNPRSKSIQTFNATPTQPFSPLSCITKFNSLTNQPVTATVYGTWNGATVPNNNIVWLDVEYFGNSATTKGNLVSSGQGSLANGSIFLPGQTQTPTNVDTSTWINGGSNNFSISVTFTPAVTGPLRAYLNFGGANVASGNIHIDPVLYLTNSSNNLLSAASLTYNTLSGVMNESGPVGPCGLIIQGT